MWKRTHFPTPQDRGGRPRRCGLLLALSATLAGQVFALPPASSLSDLRPEALRDGISSERALGGRELLRRAQDAWGVESWRSHSGAEFEMTATWHVPDSGWPNSPQRFHLEARRLGADDAVVRFLDGPEAGSGWALLKGSHYDVRAGEWEPKPGPDPHRKPEVKNWWFQFPFRISEADVIADAGVARIGTKRYRLLFATWESAEPNPTYDQYLLYLDPETLQLDWLAFTHRKKAPDLVISMELRDHRLVAGVLLPHHYLVHPGMPGQNDFVVHENVYHSIRFDPPRGEDR